MARELRWTRHALRRLDEIASWIALDNVRRAGTFVQDMREGLELLRTHELGKPGRTAGTREWVLHRHYIAVYRIRGTEVQILTLLHTAQKR